MKRKSVERFNEIVKVFAFYGFGMFVDTKMKDRKKSAENLRKAFETLGPTFVKIGQILSTRRDVLPKEYVSELIKLQDSVNKENYLKMKEVFEISLNKKIEECFFEFNKEPIASASIAQAYEGILKDGRKVVVKIQRPDIYEKMKLDISILKRVIKFTKLKTEIKVVDFFDVVDEMEKTIDKELNFKIEGDNIKRFKHNNESLVPLYVPELIEDLWSDKVITLEKIDGFKVNNRKLLKEEGYDNKDVAKTLALCYCKQVFEDGFFHGDPHPGNILIFNNRICFIDFGIMGEINESIRHSLNKVIFAIATNDREKVVEFVLSVGVQQGRVNKGILYEDISYLLDSYVTRSLKNIKISDFFEELFEVADKNHIQMLRELVSLFRSLVILEGVLEEIDPEIDILSAVNIYIKSKGEFKFFNEFNIKELSMSSYSFIRDIGKIPTKLNEVLNSIYNGRNKINFHVVDLDKTINALDKMVNRITGGFIISALLIASSLLIRDGAGPIVYGLSLIGVVGYLISSIFAIILLGSMVRGSGNNKKYK